MSAERHTYTTVWSDETCIRMADTNMVSHNDVLHVEMAQELLQNVVVEGSVLRLVF